MNATQLSFLPDDYMERKVQRRTNAVCAVIFILVMGALGGAFYVSERATRKIDEEFRQVDAQYVREAKQLQQFKQIQEQQKRMAHQAEVTSSLVERVQRNFILAEFTNALTPGVSLVELTLDSRPRAKVIDKSAAAPAKTAYEQQKAARAAAADKPANPGAPEPKQFDVQVKLTGVAKTDIQVAAYLKRLSDSPLFKEVNLVISEEYLMEQAKAASSALPPGPSDKEAAKAKAKEIEREVVRRFQIEMTLNPEGEVTAADVTRVTNMLANIEIEK